MDISAVHTRIASAKAEVEAITSDLAAWRTETRPDETARSWPEMLTADALIAPLNRALAGLSEAAAS